MDLLNIKKREDTNDWKIHLKNSDSRQKLTKEEKNENMNLK